MLSMAFRRRPFDSISKGPIDRLETAVEHPTLGILLMAASPQRPYRYAPIFWKKKLEKINKQPLLGLSSFNVY
jgi:hypothetical protein